MPVLYEVVYERLESDLSINTVTKGRYVLSSALRTALQSQGPERWVFGNGIGVFEERLAVVLNRPVAHVQNDLLRLLHDYGLFGFTLIILAFYSVTRREPGALILLLMFGALMLVDNVFIYLYFHFTLFMCMRALIQEGAEPQVGVT
jgi:hypothetical protein